MLVASLVRKTLALKSHKVVRVAEESGRLVVELDRRKGRRLPCSICLEPAGGEDRLKMRRWRHVPLWGIPVELRYRPCRVSCRTCGVRVESIPWSAGKSPIAVPLMVVLATWSRILAWDVVATLFGVSWQTVVDTVDAAVEYGRTVETYAGVTHIGIDEISRKKGHVYHTNVYDLTKRRLIWSEEGRGKDTIEAFFTWFGDERTAALQGICCDMWANYVDVCRLKASQATLVFDKFHIVAHLMRAVDDVRRMEAKALRATYPELLKGTRYIFLKNPWNLTDNQQIRLRELERFNLKTLRAYLLKEMFAGLWTYTSRAWAKRFLDRWFWWATHSRLKPLRDFAWMLRRHQEGILAYFECRIDNGATEAMNNNAKAVSHRARGFRTARAFTLAQLHCLGKLPLPETTHRFA